MGELLDRIPDSILEEYDIEEVEDKFSGDPTHIDCGEELPGTIIGAIQEKGFKVANIDWDDGGVMFKEMEDVRVVDNTDINGEEIIESLFDIQMEARTLASDIEDKIHGDG